MASESVLLVDDEEDILELVGYSLTKNGYSVTGVTSGEEVLRTAGMKPPDLVVLDLMLPGVDGLDVCRRLKSNPKTQHVPVVMLTAKGEEADVVAGLEIGADDYITKPFSPRVLQARIKAVLRRKRAAGSDEKDRINIRLGPLTISPARHEVRVDDEPVQLTFTEFRILHFLARNPGFVFSRYQIVDGVQGQNVVVTERSIDVHIVSLRRKMGTCAKHIETVRRVGYRFKDIT